MTLNLDMDADYQKEFDFDLEETGKEVMEGTLDRENCPYEAEVNLVLTDNEEIRRTNREFRDIDRETDVLSFPMLEYDRPGDFSHAEEDESCFNPDTGELILGGYYDLCAETERAGGGLWTFPVKRVCFSYYSQPSASDGL